MATESGQVYERLPEDETAPLEILYEDEYVQVSTRALVIKRYYFPSLGSRAIPWNSIEWVKLARDASINWFGMKCWGMGISPVWWNCKARLIVRGSRWYTLKINGVQNLLSSNIVVKVKDAYIRPGSYVDCPDLAMAAIGQLIFHNHPHSN
ncbi:hypothetical protein GGH96_005474 [Coemansia sp. RSA 1972]|nr:hypothetical protein GGH96_005474 [Coemansia sp. RSA 1972]